MRVFIYCRVARDDTFALEHQRFLLQLYAKRAGYTIIGAADEYGSGLTLDRPGMGKVTQAVLAGEVDVVVSRFQTMTCPWPSVFVKETASKWNKSIRSLLESAKRNVSN